MFVEIAVHFDPRYAEITSQSLLLDGGAASSQLFTAGPGNLDYSFALCMPVYTGAKIGPASVELALAALDWTVGY